MPPWSPVARQVLCGVFSFGIALMAGEAMEREVRGRFVFYIAKSLSV